MTHLALLLLLLGPAAATASSAASASAARRASPLLGSAPLLAAAERRALAHAARARGAAPARARTIYGDVDGIDDGRVAQWLGVPFAAPPVGDLRFSPPRAPQPWGAPLNATWWGPVCPQDEPINFYWGLFSSISEDCLNLNVYAPGSGATSQRPPGGWPMMLWFFGGGFEAGAGGFPVYDGYFAVNKTQSVIIVTMNYRVSTLGWLTGAPLAADSPDGSNGNFGLQDARRALQFLVDTGASFGGDPARITIFGESAGGGIVSHLLTNKLAAGKFQRAIIESGPLAAWITSNLTAQEARYGALCAAVACPTEGAASLACLRGKSYADIMNAGQTVDTDLNGPVVDGVEVQDDPRRLAARGQLAPGVRVMLGTNRDEGTFGPPANLTLAAFEAAVVKDYGAELGALVLQAYPAANYSSPGAAYYHIGGDHEMTCPNRDTAQWLTAAGRVGGPQAAYVYLYEHTNAFLHSLLGLEVAHATDLLNVWDIEPLLGGPGEQAQADYWVRAWARFAATGDPNGPNPVGGADPTWLEYGGSDVDSWGVLDTSAAGPSCANVRGVRKAQCDFWASQGV